MSFVAGPFLATYNGKVVGQTAQGFRFDRQVFKKMITGDWMGDAPQEAIYRGMELTSSFTLLEADAPAVVDIIRPYQGAATGIHMGTVGLLDCYHGLVKPLVLTSLFTAAVTGGDAVLPLTRTLPRSILMENFPISELLAADLRDVPIRMRHYPSAHNQATGTGGGQFGTET